MSAQKKTGGVLAIAVVLLCVLEWGQAVDVRCESAYKGFSDCVLALGQSLDNQQENVTSETGVAAVCDHWENFHSCALKALANCTGEVRLIWETLRQDSKKMPFQGSLFDLCPSASPRISAPLWVTVLPLLGLLLELSGQDWAGV
ncbi:neuritin-like [Boleophthalmus pectinirostris]|uniref:neuritin-like n=1 Tax=Boleophthalmus pectinirostris TaxID=150288 RepID=UPI000A1C37FE|nr:neuritin-like [Boleophthalmus pectinirostris]